MINLIPVIIEETGKLKHGDIFTVSPTSGSPGVPKEFAANNTFIAVPHNYESRSLRKIWAEKIKQAKIKYGN